MKNMIKKLLAIFALGFAGTALATTVEVTTFAELKSAIKNTSVDVINVAANIDVPCASSDEYMSTTAALQVKRNLTIQGKDAVQYTLKRTGSTSATGNGSYLNRSILEIYGNATYDGVTVTLRNIIFDGGAVWASGSTPQTRFENRGDHPSYKSTDENYYGKSSQNSGVAGHSVIDVANKATLNLEGGAVVQNGECTNNARTGTALDKDNKTNVYGGGIRVECFNETGGGTINVKSGAIVQDCVANKYGGGIGAYNLARINVYGGTIRRCSARVGGGIGVTWADDAYDSTTEGKAASKTHSGVISTSGGLIEDCWAQQKGGALAIEGTAKDCEEDDYYKYSRILNLTAKNCVAEDGAALAAFDGANTTVYLTKSPAVTATDCTGPGNYTGLGYKTGDCIYKDSASSFVEITSIHTLTFVDGADLYGQVEVEHGRTAGAMFPADPARTGMVFTEWRTNLLDSTSKITKDTVINADVTAYAYWVSVKVSFDSATVPNTTYQVFLKDSPITPDSTGKYYVPSNEQNIVVVYTANSGYYFADGTTVKTNAVITSTNPATVQTPLPAAASNHKHCICGTGTCAVGGHTHADIVWAEWTKTDSLPTTAGNYYLANDVTLTAEYKPVSGVNLCLNGHTVTQTTSGKRVISVVSTSSMADHTFALTDCVQSGKITGGTITGSNNYGGGVNVATNSSVASGRSVFKYYGGIICGNTATSIAKNGSGCGGGVCVNSGCEFYMYGGVISNNTATSVDNYTGTGRGGGLFVSGTGKALVYGGDICYNTANRYGGGVEIGSGSSDVKPTMTFGGKARVFGNKGGCGGGICCDTGSQLTVTGGEIFGNEAKDDYLKGGDKGKGGGIFLYAGPHAISDCSIYNNTAAVNGGGFYYDDATAVTIGGTLVVTNNTVGGTLENVYFPSGKKVTLSSLASDSKIGVTTATTPAAYEPVAITANGTAGDVACFTSDNAAYEVRFAADHLVLSVHDVEVKAPDPMPANTTFSVITNGVLVELKDGKYLVVSNSTDATVIFATQSGYYFADGSVLMTNTVDTSKNPAKIQGGIPAAPFKLSVTNVTARQRYPWNGLVDIDVTIVCGACDVEDLRYGFVATNTATKKVLTVGTITPCAPATGSGVNWQRSFVWDAQTDLGNVQIKDIAFAAEVWKGSVDLGLDYVVSTLYVGSVSPEDIGLKYAWGELKTKKSYTTGNSLTHGKSKTQLQEAGIIDANGNLTPEYDVATQRFGAPWRLPTKDEWQELKDNCNWTFTTVDGIKGTLVTSKQLGNSNSVFLPITGYINDSTLKYADNSYYWSSTVSDYEHGGSSGAHAYGIKTDSSNNRISVINSADRRTGMAIIAVRTKTSK